MPRPVSKLAPSPGFLGRLVRSAEPLEVPPGAEARAVDNQGRLRFTSSLQTLGWGPGTKVWMTVDRNGVIVISSDDLDGMPSSPNRRSDLVSVRGQLDSRSRLPLARSVRQRAGLEGGGPVLAFVSPDPERRELVIVGAAGLLSLTSTRVDPSAPEPVPAPSPLLTRRTSPAHSGASPATNTA